MGSDEERDDEPGDVDPSDVDGATSENDAPEQPRKKKKRRKKASKKKRRKKKTKRLEGSDAPEPKAESDDGAPKRRIPWLAIILVIAAVELFLFGSRGRIEVCVAKDGVHDFDLVGTPRTEDNTARYPSCETRLNIGMKSRYDDLETDAVVQACRRANMFRGKEAILTCAVQADGWKHRVTATFVKPWEPEYRKRLFWFLQ